MPHVKITTEPTSSANIASRVARTLDGGNIPHVLWGWQAIALVGVTEEYPDVDFLIPDNQVAAARECMQNYDHGRTACDDPNCDDFKIDPLEDGLKGPWGPGARNRYHVPGACHFHMNEITTLTFHPWSIRVPGWLPAPTAGAPAANDPNFSTTTDERVAPRGDLGPCGPWDGLYPVKTLSEDNLWKVVDYLQQRDEGTKLGILWDFMNHSMTL